MDEIDAIFVACFPSGTDIGIRTAEYFDQLDVYCDQVIACIEQCTPAKDKAAGKQLAARVKFYLQYRIEGCPLPLSIMTKSVILWFNEVLSHTPDAFNEVSTTTKHIHCHNKNFFLSWQNCNACHMTLHFLQNWLGYIELTKDLGCSLVWLSCWLSLPWCQLWFYWWVW